MLRLVLGCVLCLCTGAANAAGSRPNILLIIGDDVGYGDVSTQTPNLLYLANESARFETAYANPYCSPTRAATYTGRYAERAHVNYAFADTGNQRMAVSEVTLAKQLKAVGYHTGLVGKWHLSTYNDNILPYGYNQQIGSRTGELNPFTYRTKHGLPDWWRGATHLGWGSEHTLYEEDNHAITFMHDAPSPWFLTLAWHAIHEPRIAPDGTRDYVKYLKAMDAAIGHVMQYVPENTIVWALVSDNGGYPNVRNAGLKGAKGTLWEGGVRVREYVRWPGHVSAGPRTGMSHVIDVMPTILDIAGVAPARALDGVSLKGALLEGTTVPERELFWSTGNSFSYSNGRRKLVLVNGTPYVFDLVADPRELRNIAGTNAAFVSAGRAKIAAWRAEVGR